ncbi:surface antigen family protein [Anaplasma phagocytophilum str. ApMUC09]|uniref:Surface antigen family protein n=1 Tax=Anaplasma phagocytophilum str. ApMUC09 TaxID=1359152 RepID=A0A0F3NB78_ANAPH|nr:surface antigen family protein [Anaplasma phagocytophilum str. ApMUC09]SCV66293.1 Major surface antigen 4 precursor [Anaplasma phagocytophilum]
MFYYVYPVLILFFCALLSSNPESIIRDSGKDEADTVYLLAKELAYDVVSGQTDNLAAALAKTSGKDIVQFANAVKISHSGIEQQVCKTKGGYSKGTQSFGKYAATTKATSGNDETAYCGGQGRSDSGSGPSTPQAFKDFAENTLKGGDNWPMSTRSGAGTPEPKPNDNAEAVAKDLVALNSDEKTIVAGLLAKTIEGGEVVEIRAVSSTSVMVNACYDLLSEGLGVVPYACVGLGGNFVGVVDEYSTIRWSLTLYAFSK